MMQEDYWCVKIISTCIFPTICLMNVCVHTRQRELIVVGFASLIALVLLFLFFICHWITHLKYISILWIVEAGQYYKYHELLKCVVLFKVVCVHSKRFSSVIFLKDYCSFLFQPSEQNNPNLRIQSHTIHFKPLIVLYTFFWGGGDGETTLSIVCLQLSRNCAWIRYVGEEMKHRI